MTKIETDVMRELTRRGIAFELLPHTHPAITIEDAAIQRGVNPCQMIKCILLQDMSHRYALACVPGNQSVDPKKVRRYLQWRRMTCVSANDIPAITGYELGTVTPFNLKTAMPVFFDPHVFLETEITISSGSRLAGIKMQLTDLIKLVSPEVKDIIRDR